MNADERTAMIDQLVNYYGCPKDLVDDALAYVEMGRDPAEVVEALVEAGQA